MSETIKKQDEPIQYEIRITNQAAKELNDLPIQIRSRILEAFEELAQWPVVSNVKKLKGYKNLYRKRVGDYRILFEVYEQQLVITVVRIAHRKDVYD